MHKDLGIGTWRPPVLNQLPFPQYTRFFSNHRVPLDTFWCSGFAICHEHSKLQLKRANRPGTHFYDSILGAHCWKRWGMIENQSRILLFNIVLLSLLTVSVPALQQTKTCKNYWAATNINFLQKYSKLNFFYSKVIITKLLAHAYDHAR